MSTPPTESHPTELASIDSEQLAAVSGGVTRSSGSADSEVTAMLTQIGKSIKDLAAQKTSGGGTDTMTLMMMMLMMGGGGGGGAVAAPAAIAPPVINLDTAVSGGGCRRGKKGW